MQHFDRVALGNQFPLVSPLMENAQFFALPELCRDWQNARAGADDRLPLRSDIPTLLVAGEFDPITPPAYAKQAARTLTKGQYVEIPNAGHGIPWFSVCATQLAVKFVDHPDVPVEKQCLASVPPVVFVTDVWLLPGVNRLVSTVRAHVSASLLVVGVLMPGLGSSVIWPVIWLTGLRRRHSPLRSGAKFIAQAMVAGAAIVSMVYIGSLAWTIGTIAYGTRLLLAFGLPARSWSLYVLPWIILALAAVSLGYLLFTWRIPWTAFERVHAVMMFSSVALLLISTGFYRLY